MTKNQKTYRINECFLSVQGEGVRAGSRNVFLRFSGCNLRCRKEKEGFDCDTEFESGVEYSLEELIHAVKKIAKDCKWIVLTGGEPTLQIDSPLLRSLKAEGFHLAIETNGLREVPSEVDWICVSPKTSEHSLRQKKADEVKYVRSAGMGLPQPSITADHYLISPAFEAEHLPKENLIWCQKLVQDHPKWKLSLQQHKVWGVR